MGTRTRGMVAALASVTLTAALAGGCGGSAADDENTSSRSPTATESTLGEDAQASPSSDAAAFSCLARSEPVRGVPVDAASLGTGSSAVILVHGAGETGCVWSDLATALADDGHRVYVYDQASDGPPLGERRSELRAMIGAAAEDGAESITLVGASRGGCLSLIEAASNPDVSAVAVLSCARAWNQDDPEPLTPYLPKVRVPVLEVVAADDPDVPIAGVRKDLDVLADGELLQVPGSDHGSALGALPQVRKRVTEFVGR